MKNEINITKIVNKAVSNAIKENAEMGVPSVFFINNQEIYKMPDGKILSKSEYEKLNQKAI